jgi:hypothetical protein
MPSSAAVASFRRDGTHQKNALATRPTAAMFLAWTAKQRFEVSVAA